MIEVTDIKEYNDIDPSIDTSEMRISPHWNAPTNEVIIQAGSSEITVLKQDIITVINNASNTNK